jgi:hypothetical protein
VLARQPDEAADPVQWARRMQHKIRHLHLRRRLVWLQLQSPRYAVRRGGTVVQQGVVLCVVVVKSESYSTLSAICMLIFWSQVRLNWPTGTFTDGFYETNYLDSVSCSWYHHPATDHSADTVSAMQLLRHRAIAIELRSAVRLMREPSVSTGIFAPRTPRQPKRARPHLT